MYIINIINIDEYENPEKKEKFISASLSYPDADIFVASDQTKNVYMFQAGSRIPLITFSNHTSPVTKMLLYTDTAEMYAGLDGGMIVLWDLNKRKYKVTLKGHSSSITSLALFKKEQPLVLASASRDGKLKIWDIRSQSDAINFKGHFSTINSLEISPSI